jgi:hypothetical protein
MARHLLPIVFVPSLVAQRYIADVRNANLGQLGMVDRIAGAGGVARLVRSCQRDPPGRRHPGPARCRGGAASYPPDDGVGDGGDATRTLGGWRAPADARPEGRAPFRGAAACAQRFLLLSRRRGQRAGHSNDDGPLCRPGCTQRSITMRHCQVLAVILLRVLLAEGRLRFLADCAWPAGGRAPGGPFGHGRRAGWG